MLLLELAAQGVRAFSPSVRVALKPGYVGLKSPTDIPAPLAGLVLALCYPDGRGGDAAFLAPGAKQGRAGLSIQGQDNEMWRIVRDLGGAGGLHKLNRATNQFEVATQDASEMGQLLRAQVGFPARTTFEQLFTFTAGQLPSRRPKQAKTVKMSVATPAKGKPQLQSAFDQYGLSSSDEAQTRERIAQLEKELVTAKRAADLQFRHDGLQADLFKVEERYKQVEALRAKLEAARAELAQAPSPQNLGLPDDIVERVRRYPDEKKRYSDAMVKLANEREQALSSSGTWVLPLYKDQRFVMSMLLGLALLIGPAFLEGGLRWLALASVPVFTFATLLALRFIEDLQHLSREAAKAEVFVQREKKLNDEFSLSNTIVQTAFEKTNVVTPDEFYTLMAKREALQPQVAALELEFAELQADPDTEKLGAEVQRLKAEMEEVNQQLHGLSGGYVREVREIERDLARLKGSVGPAAPAQTAVTEGFSAVDVPADGFDDPIPALLILGTDLFATDVPTLWSALRDRAVQYFSALSDRRYHGIDVDKEGHATAQAPGRAVAAGELPGKDLDLLYLSVRLTLLEKYSVQTRLPILIEDGFSGVIDAPKQPLFGRMLKHIGTLTQVLHVTGAAQQPVGADTVFNV
ncbi:MAG: chromosome segregation protein SMC [Myxococcota bacterium]